MRKRFTLHIVVLAVVLLATCAAFATNTENSAALANTNTVTAVAHSSLAWDAANIAATANKASNTGTYLIAGTEATLNTKNTANTGAINTVGTALVNSNTLNNAGAPNDQNSAGANKKVEQNNLAWNGKVNTGGGSGNAAGAGSS